MNDIELKVTDDSGFLALVNAAQYDSFIDANWNFEDIIQRFIKEMNNEFLIIWSTGYEKTWTVNILERPTEKKSFREFSKSIKVTEEQLYLTNYEDLTFAAQFNDIKLPLKHNAELRIDLENGAYNVTIRQMFDPSSLNYDNEEQGNFEIIFQSTTLTYDSQNKVKDIFWRT